MKLINYIEQVKEEFLEKVSWPTWPELQSSSIIVLISSMIFALVVWLIDFIFGIQNAGFWKGILGFIYSIF